MSTVRGWALPRTVGVERLARREIAAGSASVEALDIDAGFVASLAEALDAARPGLVAREAGRLAGSLGAVGARFLDDADPLRTEAIDAVARTAGLSPEMARAVLDGMARDWTAPRLASLLRVELGGPAVLDGFTEVRGRRTMAVGPSSCTQIVAGSVPGVGVSALLRSLLVKAPTLLKPGLGDVALPVLFATALGEADPELADAVAVVYWPGGATEVEAAALAGADVVVAYGADETVSEIAERVPLTTRFVGYRHRTGVAVVGREALASSSVAEETAAELGRAVALFDRRGCVSPRLVFVEEGGSVAPGRFAELLAGALGALESTLPSGPLEGAEASALQQARGTAELMEAAGVGLVRHGGADAPWTVLFEPEGGVGRGCVGRVVELRSVAEAGEVAERLRAVAARLQTVGVAGLGARLPDVGRALGRLGASRVVPLASVPFPPPWWHHDGRGALSELLRWVDLEEEAG